MTKFLISSLFLLCTAFGAHGATITPADITIIGIGGSVGEFDKGGISGDVFGQCGQATGTTYTVTDSACGVILPSPGVFGNSQFQQDPRIDGLGDGLLEDSLLFVFDNVVEFVSAEFSGLELLSNYDLYIDDVLIFNEEFDTSLDLTGNSGTTLRLVADTNFDFFYLNSLTATTPSPVPLSATTWLFFSGLLSLLGILRLRQCS